MTSTTERIHDPIHKAAYTFRHEGERLWVTTWLEDGGHLPEHFHPSLEEHWAVLDGPVRVAPNVRHELKNESGSTAHLQTEVIPGGGLEEFLTESAYGARAGLYNGRNLPTSLRGAVWIAALANRFRHETVMCSPPPALQRLLLPLVARFARPAT
jgi:hypothetical protein